MIFVYFEQANINIRKQFKILSDGEMHLFANAWQCTIGLSDLNNVKLSTTGYLIVLKGCISLVGYLFKVSDQHLMTFTSFFSKTMVVKQETQDFFVTDVYKICSLSNCNTDCDRHTDICVDYSKWAFNILHIKREYSQLADKLFSGKQTLNDCNIM